MQIAAAPSKGTDPLINMLKLMTEPIKFKAHVAELEKATKDFNKAKKAYDSAVRIAKTIDDANDYAVHVQKEVDKLSAKREEEYIKQKKKHCCLEQISRIMYLMYSLVTLQN